MTPLVTRQSYEGTKLPASPQEIPKWKPRFPRRAWGPQRRDRSAALPSRPLGPTPCSGQGCQLWSLPASQGGQQVSSGGPEARSPHLQPLRAPRPHQGPPSRWSMDAHMSSPQSPGLREPGEVHQRLSSAIPLHTLHLLDERVQAGSSACPHRPQNPAGARMSHFLQQPQGSGVHPPNPCLGSRGLTKHYILPPKLQQLCPTPLTEGK